MNFKLLKITFFICLLFISGIAFSQEKPWIEGKWLHTFDPDGDTQDEIQFFIDGKFKTVEASSGKSFTGTYILEKESVKINLVHQGQVFFSLKLTFDAERDKLYLYSEETGNTSYYTRSN